MCTQITLPVFLLISSNLCFRAICVFEMRQSAVFLLIRANCIFIFIEQQSSRAAAVFCAAEQQSRRSGGSGDSTKKKDSPYIVRCIHIWLPPVSPKPGSPIFTENRFTETGSPIYTHRRTGFDEPKNTPKMSIFDSPNFG